MRRRPRTILGSAISSWCIPVNGGPEQSVMLFGGRTRLPEVTAGHTFYLEELDVEPGGLCVLLRTRAR